MRSPGLWSVLVLGLVLGTWGQYLGTTAALFPLQLNNGTPELFPMPPCGSFNLEEATIDQMQQAMEDGTLTSQGLVLCYLQRTYQTQEYIK
jgi:amidase